MFQAQEGNPVLPPPIDISHLTEEERSKIREVLNRQRKMENETASIQKYVHFYCFSQLLLCLFFSFEGIY